MMRKFSQRFTYANVASTLALVIAIGGGGAAVAAVAINSVGSPQIIDGSIKTRDLGASSVKTGKIADGTVRSADVTNDSLTSTDVKAGTLKHSDLTPGPIGVVRGYAWVDDGATTLSTPVTLTNSYVYNGAGGVVTVTRSSTGVYSVNFAGLDIFPGNVQVTGYSSSVTWCKVSSWGSSSATIRCFDETGAPANSLFSLAMIE